MVSSSSTSPVGICDAENEKVGFDVCSFCQPLNTLAPEASPPGVAAGDALLNEAHPSAFGASAGLLNIELPPWNGDGLFCSVLCWGANKLLVVCGAGAWAGCDAPKLKLGVVVPLALGWLFEGCAPNVNEFDGAGVPFCEGCELNPEKGFVGAGLAD